MHPNGPDHPIVKQVEDHWHKIAAVLMCRLKQSHVVITSEELVAALTASPERTMVLQELNDGLHIHYIPIAEAKRLAKGHLN